MQCTKPIIITKNLDRIKYPDGLSVPCGKCLACRIQKRKEWSMRCLHEMDSWDDAIFVTLTYCDEFLPENLSISKVELQNFFKRLRKAIYPRVIRFIACGEYGEPEKVIITKSGRTIKTIGDRPHYHCIIYGMSLKDEDKEIIRSCWKKCDWKKLEESKDGNPFGLAEPDSIRYVCQYIDKKYTGDMAEIEYKQKGREPVFKLQSKGIGLEFCLKNKKQLIENESITMFGVNQTFPRYYLKKLGLENSDFRKEKSLERERKRVKKFTGKDCQEIEYYKSASSAEYIKYNEAQKAILEQRNKTLLAKVNLKKKKL